MSRIANEVFKAEERAVRIRAGHERRRPGDVILCLFKGHFWIYAAGGDLPVGAVKRFCVRCGTSEVK